jgi:hypothetical protein
MCPGSIRTVDAVVQQVALVDRGRRAKTPALPMTTPSDVRSYAGPSPHGERGRPAFERCVIRWLDQVSADGAPPRPFPIDELLASLQRTGKLRASEALLAAVERARSVAGRSATLTPLTASFLAVAADRRDDGESYLGIPVLEASGDELSTTDAAVRLVHALLADLLLFEWETSQGRERRFATLVGSSARLAQRIDRIVRALATFEPRPHGRADSARPVHDAVTRARADLGSAPASLRDALRYSMLPMSTVHDEYLFIRVRQCFETLFGLLVSAVDGARRAASGGDMARAARGLGMANGAFAKAPALFSVLTTMPPAHFRAFNAGARGSTALGSRNVKRLELLCCRATAATGFASGALGGVPELSAELADELVRLDELYGSWRRTHFAFARRWIGDAADTRGTDAAVRGR